ncbi:MAG TPA: DUF2383 domain-containing protein [Planctomycetota bacterium]|nr:DUF2383 domain-containing protein [Planctomycetota bacterium]
MRRIALPLMIAVAALLVACGQPTGGTKSSPDISKVKKLHRGELSAIDSYDEALRKLPNLTTIDLATIKAHHSDSAERLRGRIVALGGSPDASAGPWSDWAEGVTKAGAAFGEDAGLRALRAGERHGRNEYAEALDASDVDAETKTLIRDILLPRQDEHIRILDGGIKTN